MMHGDGMMNGWGMMGPLMWVFMLLFWGFAIYGVICAARYLFGRSVRKRAMEMTLPWTFSRPVMLAAR